MKCLSQFSIELAPNVIRKTGVPTLIKAFNDSSNFEFATITSLVGQLDPDFTIEICSEFCENNGKNIIVPHVTARAWSKSPSEMNTYIHQLSQISRGQLLLGGGDPLPLGDLKSTSDLIHSVNSFSTDIYLGIHPEGDTSIFESNIDQFTNLLDKIKLVSSKNSGGRISLISQFSFDNSKCAEYFRDIINFKNGEIIKNIDKIYFGIPGPSSPFTLAKFGAFTGVQSVNVFLNRQTNIIDKMSKIATCQFDIYEFLEEVVYSQEDYVSEILDEKLRFHIFPFGGIDKSLEYADKVFGK